MNPHVPHVPSVQGAHGSIVGVEEPVLVREHEADREPHHVARGHEVLRALGDLLAVSLDQMLVDVAHHAVGHGFGAQVEAREPHAHLMQHAFVLKVLAGLPDLEPGEDVARVRAEPVHIRHERVERVVRAEVVEPEAGHVVEGPAGERAIYLVLQTPFTLMLLDRLAHGVTGRFQRAFQSPQQGEREDQLVVVRGADHVADPVCDAPDLTHVVECRLRFSHALYPFPQPESLQNIGRYFNLRLTKQPLIAA